METCRIVDKQVVVIWRPRWDQHELRVLGIRVRANLKHDQKRRVEKVGAEVEALLA